MSMKVNMQSENDGITERQKDLKGDKDFAIEEVESPPNTENQQSNSDGQKYIDPKNIFSYVWVSWMTPLMKLGYRRTLNPEDLYLLNEQNQAENVSNILDPYWRQLEEHLKDSTKPQPRLFQFVLKAFWLRWALSLLLNTLSVGCELAIPMFIQQVLIFVQPVGSPGRDGLWFDNGLGLAFCILSLQVGTSALARTSELVIREVMMNVRTLLIGAIYEKSLRLSGEAAQKFNQGTIMNMINVDCEQLTFTIFFFNLVESAPIQIIVATVLLLRLLGYTVWAGIGVLFFSLLLQGPIMALSKKYRVKVLKAGDERLKSVRETLHGINIIKLRSWEEFFLKKIFDLRRKQLSAIKGSYVALLGFISLGELAPSIMPIVAFIVYSAVEGGLEVTVVFPAIVLFNILFAPMFDLPQGITHLIMGYVSWSRISKFLLATETRPLLTSRAEGHEAAVSITDGAFKWEAVRDEKNDKKQKKTKEQDHQSKSKKKATKDEESDTSDTIPNDSSITVVVSDESGKAEDVKPLFTDLSLSFKRGALTAVIGAVGAAKSSLLSAIIGEMTRLKGEVKINGTIGYCTQQPWIQTDTLRANILFGQPNDDKKLSEVVKFCSLDTDLRHFPAGVDTEIGKVNLSGGQKARVALARAVYANCDILLLDDPISALDANVGHQVFTNCIKGALANKTRILVTHHLHLMQDVDHIIVLKDGAVAEQGSFNDLMVKGGIFTNIMKDYRLDDIDAKKGAKEAKAEETSEEQSEGPGGLIVAEDRVVGAVKWKTFKAYLDAAGGFKYAIGMLAVLVLAQGAQVMTNYWLTWWTKNEFGWENNGYLLGYALLGAGSALFNTTRTLVILAGNYFVAKAIHNQALARLLYAPMGFFDTQPIGRLLNRFSKDTDAIDGRMWGDILMTCLSAFHILGAVALLSVVSPYMLLFFVPLGIMFYYILRFYRATFRELKRIDSTQRSPLYALISESLTGIPTIRAYKAERRFVQRQRELMDLSSAPYYLMTTAQVWIMIRLELSTSLIAFILTMMGVTKVIDAALVGLAFTYAVPLIQYINMLLRSFAMLESNMNSIERLQEYMNDIAQEAPAIQGADPKPDVWPTKGDIAIRNLELRYPSRPEYAVLRDLSLDIKPGEKVGIVGRTGSGKSTLLTALFRVVEPSQGSIHIDGQDISLLGLKTLRSRIQIIPQDPVLFSGTIRSNLDVQNEFTDAELWETLERINLKTYVAELPDKLESKVAMNGENLSLGQRQLICLGRAILMKPVVLVMDEATASVDAQADQLIQRSIQTHFANATVLSIAHRLNTIADFDRVLVLDNGVKTEYDTPHNLLANPESLFSQLADATGPANAQLLREIAAAHQMENEEGKLKTN